MVREPEFGNPIVGRRAFRVSLRDLMTLHAPQIPRDAGVLRYVQCHQIPETYAESTPAYDGVAELWFADHASFLNYWTSPRIQKIFGDDAPRFLDGATCTAFLAQEYRVRWP